MPCFDVYVTRHEATVCLLKLEANSVFEAEALVQKRLDSNGTKGFKRINSTVTELEINSIEEAEEELPWEEVT